MQGLYSAAPLGQALFLPKNIEIVWKNLFYKRSSLFFRCSGYEEKKCLITFFQDDILPPVSLLSHQVSLPQNLSLQSLTLQQNKLACLSRPHFLRATLNNAIKSVSQPSRVGSQALIANISRAWKNLFEKRSSLFCRCESSIDI